jgi:hypothetical protein
MQHIAWAGCLMVAFIFGIHVLTVKANRMGAEKLAMPWFWGLLATLALGFVIWVFTFPS